MNDGEMEDLLRQVRPAGPPPHLRARILGTASRPAWPWMVAAAATLVMTIGLQMEAAHLRESARSARPGPRDLESELTAAVQASTGLSEREARVVAMAGDLRSRMDEARASREANQERQDR
jgi:hypothetical protein